MRPPPPEDQWLTIGDALARGDRRVYIDSPGWYPELEHEQPTPWRLSELEDDE
jgi:hypothetical protein